MIGLRQGLRDRLRHGSVAPSTTLDPLAVNAWSAGGSEAAASCLFFSLIVNISVAVLAAYCRRYMNGRFFSLQVEGMNMSGDVSVSHTMVSLNTLSSFFLPICRL